ncbi:MAG: ATP-binding protein [Actinomycetota bacterium]
MSLRLKSTPEAAGVARRALGGSIDAVIGAERAADFRLAVSELVTNAVRHGGLRSSDEIEVSVEAADGTVHVAVEQPTSAAKARKLERPERGPIGGFGLFLVDQLADRWGVDPGPPGRVWLEIC